MVNKTRKLSALQKLVKKYAVTKSGSKKEVALRLWKLRMHVMSVKDLKTVEDFLKLEPAKRYKGPMLRIKLS
jgi:hypothetical protein